MNKQELYDYIVYENMQGKETKGNQRERELIQRVLDEAEGMEEIEQYNFLCRMLDSVPERIIRQVYY